MFDFNNHILQSFGYEEIIGMSGKDGLVRLVVIKGWHSLLVFFQLPYIALWVSDIHSTTLNISTSKAGFSWGPDPWYLFGRANMLFLTTAMFCTYTYTPEAEYESVGGQL